MRLPASKMISKLASHICGCRFRHRKAIRTTNLLERLFGEERRRMKVIPNAWGKGRAQAVFCGDDPGFGEVALDWGDRL